MRFDGIPREEGRRPQRRLQAAVNDGALTLDRTAARIDGRFEGIGRRVGLFSQKQAPPSLGRFRRRLRSHRRRRGRFRRVRMQLVIPLPPVEPRLELLLHVLNARRAQQIQRLGLEVGQQAAP